MNISVNHIDSRALGRTVLDLSEVRKGDDFPPMERDYLAAENPAYVACKLSVEDLSAIHLLEKHGFCFVEFQIRMSCNLTNAMGVSQYRYRFERVTTEEALEPVLEIASSAFVDDRFSIDPLIPPGVSAERYRLYVINSFSSPDERVYRLVKEGTAETVAFKTHRILNDREAMLLLGAPKQEYQRTPIPVINEYFELNLLRERGIRKIYTHVSGRNYPIMNLEIKGVGFRVEAGFVVLRKHYA